MSRAFELYLQDILESTTRIRGYVEGLNQEQFQADSKTVDAVVRNLEIIGEATKHLPDSIRDANPEVPWRQIAGFRDVLIHNYFIVNLDIVWNVVQAELPSLARHVDAILQDSDSQSL